MKDQIQRFLVHLEEERGSAQNTVQAYRTDLMQFREVLDAEHGASLGALDAPHLKSYSDWLWRQGYRPATVARKIAAVRSFLEYLSQQDLDFDPELRHAIPTPVTTSRQSRVLTEIEVQQLLQAPADLKSPRGLRDQAILNLLYETGMRATEVVELSLDDLDLQTHRVRISGDLIRFRPLQNAKTSLERYVQEGRPFLARSADEKALFLNQRGSGLSRQGLWLLVKRWADASGLGDRVSPHSLRYTLAYQLMRQGKSRQEVQKFLGLSSANALRILLANLTSTRREQDGNTDA